MLKIWLYLSRVALAFMERGDCGRRIGRALVNLGRIMGDMGHIIE